MIQRTTAPQLCPPSWPRALEVPSALPPPPRRQQRQHADDDVDDRAGGITGPHHGHDPGRCVFRHFLTSLLTNANVPEGGPFRRSCGPAGIGFQERVSARLGQRADTANVCLPLGHRDHTARIEQVEQVACLDALVVGGGGPSRSRARSWGRRPADPGSHGTQPPHPRNASVVRPCRRHRSSSASIPARSGGTHRRKSAGSVPSGPLKGMSMTWSMPSTYIASRSRP